MRDAIVACDMLRRLGEVSAAKWQQPEPSGLMTCYSIFAGHVAGFGAAEQAILVAMDLEMLASAAWWTRLVLFAAQPEPSETVLIEVAALRTRIVFLIGTLPKLLQSFSSLPASPDASTVLIIRLPNPAGRASLPQRVSITIEAVTLLWDVVTALTGQPVPAPGQPFVLRSFANEPEPLLEFTGTADTVAGLRAIFASLWGEIVAHHTLGATERAEQIPRSLPLMRAIEEVGEPRSTPLRIKAEQGVRLFLETGANTPDMDEPTRLSPALLLRPAVGLLTGGLPQGGPGPVSVDDRRRPSTNLAGPAKDSGGSASGPPGPPVALETLIAEERELLLIEMQRRKESDRTARSWVGKRPPE